MPRPSERLTAVSLLLFPLLAHAQWIGEPPCMVKDPARPHFERPIVLSHSTGQVPDVYVAGGVPTILHLPARVSARGTGIRGGGERRFSVLMGGRQVVITPARSLADGERFPMLVALADGSVIPLSLTSAPKERSTDGVVEIIRAPQSADQLQVELASMTAKAKGFEASLRRALKEQDSENYALAGLLAGGQAKLTSFVGVRDRRLMDGASRIVSLMTFGPKPDDEHLTSQVAALFTVTNISSLPLDVSDGRALHGSDDVAVAIRAQPRVIPPEGVGLVAVVLDRTAFGPDGAEKVQLDLYARGGGMIQLSTDLVLEDFTASRPRPRPSPPAKPRGFWWLF